MRPASSAITRMRRLASSPAGSARCSPSCSVQSPEQVAGDALLAETLRGLASAARAGRLPGDGRAARARTARARPTTRRSERSTPTAWSSPGRASTTGAPRAWSATGSRSSSRVPARPRGPSVDIDNSPAARGAVEHLIALGHRRIACITNAPLVYTAAHARLAGYRDALAAAGLDASTRTWSRRRDFDAAQRPSPRWPGCSAGPASTPSSWPVTSSPSAPSARCARRVSACRRRLGRRLRRHRPRRLLRSTAHHRPAAGLRARAGRRTSAPGTDRRPGAPSPDAAPHRAHRPRLDGQSERATDRRGLTAHVRSETRADRGVEQGREPERSNDNGWSTE